jgi:hypothetical protein
MTVDRSTISGNTASNGGGVFSHTEGVDTTGTYPTTEKATITNSTISGNRATSGDGGGVYNHDGITEIEHSTITNNTAPNSQGSGVLSYGDEFTRTEVYSSIISGNTNTDDTGTDVDFILGYWSPGNSFLSEGYNLIGDGNATAAFNKRSDQKDVADPGLVPLSLNAPGTTMTHALKPTSLAINAGAPNLRCPAIDQRGFDRPQENRCDTGSFERQVTPPSVIRVVPVENAAGIAPSANVSALFSEAMRATSVKSAFKLYEKGSTTAISATITYDAATKRAVLNPSANLKRGVTYKAVVSSGAKDLAGNSLDQRPGVTGNQMKVWFFTIQR